MKITLKNIRYNERLSEETHSFSADLYIDDVKAGEASNYGHGGPTDYQAKDEVGKKLIEQAEEYCKGLPPNKFTVEGKEYSLPVSLESFIDSLVDDYLNQRELQKFRKKIDKDSERGIVFGIPDKSYQLLGLKYPVDVMLANPAAHQALVKILAERIAPELTEGKIILNTNIPEKVLKEAGLKEDQYVKPVEQQKAAAPRKKRGKKL